MTLINDVKSVMQTDMGVARAIHDLYVRSSFNPRSERYEHSPESSVTEQDIRFASDVFARNNFYNVSIKLANELNDDDLAQHFKEMALEYHLTDSSGRIGNATNYAEELGKVSLAAQLSASTLEAEASNLCKKLVPDRVIDLANFQIHLDRYRERFPDALSPEEFEEFRILLFNRAIDSYAQRNDFAWAAKIATVKLQDEELATELYGKDAEKTLGKLRAELAQLRSEHQEAYDQYTRLGCLNEAKRALDPNDPVMQYNHFFRQGSLDIALREAKEAERPDLVQEVMNAYDNRIGDFLAGANYWPASSQESAYILSLAERFHPDRIPEVKVMARINAEGCGEWKVLAEGKVCTTPNIGYSHRFKLFDPSPEEENVFKMLSDETSFCQLWQF